MNEIELYDVLVIGGGQSGLATGYYLRRTSLNYLILDKEAEAGGSWIHYWESLRLFSPAQWSSLPGTLMEGGPAYYPNRDETVAYLKKYEAKYKLAVERSLVVERVKKDAEGLFQLYTNKGKYKARCLVSCTGSFSQPILPALPGMDSFKGEILHSADYQEPSRFKGKKVVVVGEGNSGAQILAELSNYATTLWVCSKPPRFLPDDVDGRVLFDSATALYKARQEGKPFTPPSLGDIVMVPPVKEARARGVLEGNAPIQYFTENSVVLSGGQEYPAEVIIFCTGFKPALSHLEPLGIVEKGKVDTAGTRAKGVSGLWLVGYGSWTGFASATLIGVGRSARQTVKEIQEYLNSSA